MIKALIDIFSPKGEITGSGFAVNYLILRMIYFILTFTSTYILFNANQDIPFFGILNIVFLILVLFIELIILFNFKKRLLNICGILWISILLAVIFTFVAEFAITLFFNQWFLIASSLHLIIIPIIVAILPPKGADLKEYWLDFRNKTVAILKYPVTICAIAFIIGLIVINQLSIVHNNKIVKLNSVNEEKLVINPLSNYTYKSVEEITNIRKKYVATSIFKNETYEPDISVFGQMQDKKAWWGIDHIICYDEKQNTNIRKEGLSEESRFINNPNMLLGVLVSQIFERTPDLKSLCEDKALQMIPTSITYDKKYRLITATYKATPNFMKQFGKKGHIKFLLTGLNARDFGYKYAYAINTANIAFNPAYSIKGNSLDYGIVKFEDHIALGKACEVDGGCNNTTPYQPALEFIIMKLPAKITISLWKHKPMYKNQPASMYYKIKFEQ
ncbi:MAG: hypothetical protein DKM24_04665 [Candidatus Melainabacteria bacterium]|nr:MAG: hypothetical protein DKM24_04665 [Candidatus Melainabacteria bacterium]